MSTLKPSHSYGAGRRSANFDSKMDYDLIPDNTKSRRKTPHNPFSGSATLPSKRFASFSGGFLTMKKTGGL